MIWTYACLEGSKIENQVDLSILSLKVALKKLDPTGGISEVYH